MGPGFRRDSEGRRRLGYPVSNLASPAQAGSIRENGRDALSRILLPRRKPGSIPERFLAYGMRMWRRSLLVMAGLDPAIQPGVPRAGRILLDPRVKPGGDEGREWRPAQPSLGRKAFGMGPGFRRDSEGERAVAVPQISLSRALGAIPERTVGPLVSISLPRRKPGSIRERLLAFRMRIWPRSPFVMAGLDPAIQLGVPRAGRGFLDPRVKPGGDEGEGVEACATVSGEEDIRDESRLSPGQRGIGRLGCHVSNLATQRGPGSVR